MGEKNQKHKTGKPNVPSRATGSTRSANAASEALKSLTIGCCHGRKITDFNNFEYKRAVQAYIRMCWEVIQIGKVRVDNHFIECKLQQKFSEDHQHLLPYNTNFCVYVFGFCTNLYLKINH